MTEKKEDIISLSLAFIGICVIALLKVGGYVI